MDGSWIIAGDFNLLRDEEDKNNENFNHTLATTFNNTIDSLALMELPLLDRLQTWTNNRAEPTLTHLDRVFLNMEMTNTYPNTTLTTLSRTTSDHTPLLASISTTLPKPHTFRFETPGCYTKFSCPQSSLPGTQQLQTVARQVSSWRVSRQQDAWLKVGHG